MARKTATMDVRPAPILGQLPDGPGLFVGRGAELAALAAARTRVVAGRCPLLVVAGRPGSGRTSLAVRFAVSVAEEYPDGVLFARLSAPDGTRVAPGTVARRLLEQLGEPAAGALPTGEEQGEDDPACAAVRAAVSGRRVLLVLDDARDSGQLWPLLATAPEALVVATTAGPLTGIEGIDPVILGGLSQSGSVELLSGLVGGTRISCDPVGAAGLAESCACRPTALRLMAGWLRAAPKAAVTDAARELSLAVEMRTPPEPARKKRKGRAQSADDQPAEDEPVPVPDGDPLGAAFTLLHRSLPAAEARMLRMLTLAPAQSADLRTASALVGCPAPEAATLLEKLTERELLDREGESADGTPRYRVPGRLYGRLVALREELDRPSELELARARLLERLVRLVESARALLDPAAGPGPDPLPGPLRLRTPAQARLWLTERRGELLGAVGDAIGQADLDGSAGRLVTALLRALPLTGQAAPADLYELHGLVLKVAERSGNRRRAAAALLNLGDLQAAAGRWEVAAERYRAALEHGREVDDEAACARALEGVAESRRALGDPVRAADWYGRALELRQGLGDHRAEARLLARTAEAHLAQRRFEEAEREYRAALAVVRRLGDERGQRAVAAALEHLRGLVEAERGRATSE
ncbi:tetratricopeptide (TPR) repeat protein [Kitasatospora gansuensis]|uniref:Tetratricopeptide (TPR) repeat protein n=1 Tax=Kitasatospora gansuensis TaxID=258050 RepID=A0A7W7SAA0_9ACTN|nr:tetratricopeptide repeat protein [Kitasatospora gansuensis]MBB4946178.1 tetratricopeptide (TPR) repeat protein [Kitasatospora gansuensis]